MDVKPTARQREQNCQLHVLFKGMHKSSSLISHSWTQNPTKVNLLRKINTRHMRRQNLLVTNFHWWHL